MPPPVKRSRTADAQPPAVSATAPALPSAPAPAPALPAQPQLQRSVSFAASVEEREASRSHLPAHAPFAAAPAAAPPVTSFAGMVARAPSGSGPLPARAASGLAAPRRAASGAGGAAAAAAAGHTQSQQILLDSILGADPLAWAGFAGASASAGGATSAPTISRRVTFNAAPDAASRQGASAGSLLGAKRRAPDAAADSRAADSRGADSRGAATAAASSGPTSFAHSFAAAKPGATR